MRPVHAALGAGLIFLAAACQGGGPLQGATPTAGASSSPASTDEPAPTEPASGAPGAVSALDGTISFTSDGGNAGPGSRSEGHKLMTVTVHLVAKDGGPGFVDAGSSFVYSETSTETDDQTASSCGMHVESSGKGGGAFASPDGLIVGYYSSFEGTVTLGVHAPYTQTGSLTTLCNGLTSKSTTAGLENPACGDPAGGAIVGKIQPGNAIDFTCSEPFAIGTGTVTVTGSLTSH